MPCLVCARPVGIFRRFKDPQFCSDEHRRDWTGTREQVLIDRLLEARVRIERARDRCISRTSARVAPAQPPMGEFLSRAPVEFCGALVPAATGPTFGTTTRICMPRVPVSIEPRRHLAGFRADLPWPAWNAGLRTFGDLGLEALACSPDLDYSRAAARIFGAWKPYESFANLPVTTLSHVRRPDVMGRRAIPLALPSGIAIAPPVRPSLTLGPAQLLSRA